MEKFKQLERLLKGLNTSTKKDNEGITIYTGKKGSVTFDLALKSMHITSLLTSIYRSRSNGCYSGRDIKEATKVELIFDEIYEFVNTLEK